MFASILLNNIETVFNGKKLLTFEEIYSFARKYEPYVTKANIRSRLTYLKKQSLIASVFSNTYTVDVKNKFNPVIGSKLMKINRALYREFKDTEICFAETRWLNEYSIHQAFSSNIVCMVEEYIAESVFRFLVNKGFKVVLHPDEKDINLYINDNESVLITSLVTRSPTINSKNIRISKIEKLLVDSICDKNIYFAYQGNEIDIIFENAEKKHNINFSEMLNYSRRRGKYEILKSYLIKQFPQYKSHL